MRIGLWRSLRQKGMEKRKWWGNFFYVPALLSRRAHPKWLEQTESKRNTKSQQDSSFVGLQVSSFKEPILDHTNFQLRNCGKRSRMVFECQTYRMQWSKSPTPSYGDLCTSQTTLSERQKLRRVQRVMNLCSGWNIYWKWQWRVCSCLGMQESMLPSMSRWYRNYYYINFTLKKILVELTKRNNCHAISYVQYIPAKTIKHGMKVFVFVVSLLLVFFCSRLMLARTMKTLTTQI